MYLPSPGSSDEYASQHGEDVWMNVELHDSKFFCNGKGLEEELDSEVCFLFFLIFFGN